jgi:hypothetical protein
MNRIEQQVHKMNVITNIQTIQKRIGTQETFEQLEAKNIEQLEQQQDELIPQWNELVKEETVTYYKAWNRGLHGYTGCGGFLTSLLETYRKADAGNMDRLEKAFPEYFVQAVTIK